MMVILMANTNHLAHKLGKCHKHRVFLQNCPFAPHCNPMMDVS